MSGDPIRRPLALAVAAATVALCTLGATGCGSGARAPAGASAAPVTAAGTHPAAKVVLSPHLQGGPPSELTIWLIYGGFLETARTVALDRPMPRDWLVHADLAARQVIASRILAGDVRFGGLKSRYLREALPRIAAAGYLREHAMLDFDGDAGGVTDEIPLERSAGYRSWLSRQDLSLVPETWAALRIGKSLLRRAPRKDGPLATARMTALATPPSAPPLP